MKLHSWVNIGTAFVVALLATDVAVAQTETEPVAHTVPQLETARLDQMLAPIALYPDPLLAQVLMASTYPLEVVEADRWLRDPHNAALKGDALTDALDQQSWDPSVKSLVPFAQILRMMNGDLDWTEALGEAVISSRSAVMDEVQILRHQAEANGKLVSNSREVVADEAGDIDIEPVGSSIVYVPDYDPAVIYGAWRFPQYPPFYFPDYWTGCDPDSLGYCWVSWSIVVPLWGWDHWDWRGHAIDIDRDRFTRLDHGRPSPIDRVWEHDPSHRRGVPYQTPETQGRFPRGQSSAQEREYRGYPSQVSGEPRRAASHEGAPMVQPTRVSPIFESYGRGIDVRHDAARGQASRTAIPSRPPAAGPSSRGGGSGRNRGPRR